MAGTASNPAPRSLAEDLRGRSDDELAALLRERPDLAHPLPGDVSQLASRATTRASAHRALDRLDRHTLAVVDVLAVLPEPTTATDVGRLLGTTANEVRPALELLRRRALLWGTEDALVLVRVVRELLGPYPAGLGPPARQALLAHTPSRLARLVADLGGSPAGDPVADASWLSGLLGEPGRLEALLAEAGPEAREAALVLVGGLPLGQLPRARREVDVAGARTPVERLLARALLVPVDDDTVLLPGEVGLHLLGGRVHAEAPPDAAPEPPATIRDPGAVDRTAGAGALEAVRRTEALLDAWSQDPPQVLRSGGLGVRDLRRLPALLDTDEAGATLTVELAYAAGLLAAGGELAETWLPTPAYDAWRREGTSRRWLLLASTWLATTRVPGLVGGRDDRDRPAPPLGRDLDRPVAPEVRGLVLAVLAALPPGAAPDAGGVREAVRWHRPRRASLLRDDLVGWTMREAEALGVTGSGALATHGRALAGGEHEAAVTALDAVLPPLLDHVLVQADLTAVAPGPLRPDLARELALVADVESRGGASVYRFGADSVRRALDAGRSAADVHDFLARLSRTPVPQPLTYLVDDVARRHGRLRVGAAEGFVRCDDEALLAEVLADPRSAALGLRRLAPTVLVSQAGPQILLERLRRLGYAPAPEAADGSVVLVRALARRAPPRPRPAPLPADGDAPPDHVLAAAVRAVRAGDRSQAGRPADVVPVVVGRSGSAQVLAALQDALAAGDTVWIGYVDLHGAVTERAVDPVRVEGGWLTAYDHRGGEVRRFAVHRVSGVAAATAAAP